MKNILFVLLLFGATVLAGCDGQMSGVARESRKDEFMPTPIEEPAPAPTPIEEPTPTPIEEPAPTPIEEPAFWNEAKPYEGIQPGLYYFDKKTRAIYCKNEKASIFLRNGYESGLDSLSFSLGLDPRGVMRIIGGRLESKTMLYGYMKLDVLSKTESIVGYQNAFGAKIKIPLIRTEYEGVYFSNTAKEMLGESAYRLAFETSPKLYCEDGGLHFSFRYMVTAQQAMQIGRDATVRAYFTIEDNRNPIKRDRNPDVKIDDSVAFEDRYILYKAKLHGLKIIYDPPLQHPLFAIALFEDKPQITIATSDLPKFKQIVEKRSKSSGFTKTVDSNDVWEYRHEQVLPSSEAYYQYLAGNIDLNSFNRVRSGKSKGVVKWDIASFSVKSKGVTTLISMDRLFAIGIGADAPNKRISLLKQIKAWKECRGILLELKAKLESELP